jgi:hypothetical protein
MEWLLTTPNVAYWVSPKSTNPNVPNIIGHLTERNFGYEFNLYFHDNWDGAVSFCGWTQLFNATNGTTSPGQALTNQMPCTKAIPPPPFSDPLPWQLTTGILAAIASGAVSFILSSRRKSIEATPLNTNSGYQYQ